MNVAGRPLIFIILLFFSCTTGSKKDTESAEESHSLEEDLAEPPQLQEESKTHIVEIRQMKFEPAEVLVHKGDRVMWINKDITNHDVTELFKKAWASSPLSTGQSWSMVVTHSEEYFCNLHQVMRGKITLEEPQSEVSR